MRHDAWLRALAVCVALAGPSVAFAAAPPAAVAPVAVLNTALANAEKQGSAPFPQRYQALAPAVDQTFDLPQILHTIVGLYWSSIPAAQQTTLLAAFRAYTICNYAANFDTDSGDSFRILPESRAVGADQVVETEIVPKSGDPTRLDYVMRQTAGGWRVIDVLEQGTISQAAVQRSDFRSLISSGDAGRLIESLTAKVRTLSGGTITP
jgi:phospholipid transport system substrate-binding protein